MISKIVCIGDSLTAGYGVDDKVIWTKGLSEELGVAVINSGISGDTTGGMLARFKSMVIDHKPSHVIIMGGTNDLFLGVQMETILANFLAMTRYARHHDIEVIIGLPTGTIDNPEASNKGQLFADVNVLGPKLSELREKLRKFCIEDERYLIDFNRGLCNDDYQSDGVHPNELGNIKMLNNALETIKII